MIIVIVIAVGLYLAFHVGAGHAHYRHARAHGLSPNFYWSSVRGPWPLPNVQPCQAARAVGFEKWRDYPDISKNIRPVKELQKLARAMGFDEWWQMRAFGGTYRLPAD